MNAVSTANGKSGAPAGVIAPPHNLDAEQSVLGAILLSDRSLYALVIEEGLRADDFYRERHGAIYEGMLSLYNDSEPVDVLTVIDRLRQMGKLEDIGGEAAVDELTKSFLGTVLDQGFEALQPIGIARGLVEAQPADAREAHGDAGLVAGRPRHALECDFEHQAAVIFMHDFAHRPEAVDGIAADEAVDFGKLGVGEAEIGLAHRHQLVADIARGPDPEGVIGIE